MIVQMPESLLKSLDLLADIEGETRTKVVREAIRKHCDCELKGKMADLKKVIKSF